MPGRIHRCQGRPESPLFIFFSISNPCCWTLPCGNRCILARSHLVNARHLRGARHGTDTVFDSARPSDYTRTMELDLTPELQAKLDEVAAQRGLDAKSLVKEAVERLVDYDAWFVREVEKGLVEIERGDVLDHDEVGARLENLLSSRQRRP